MRKQFAIPAILLVLAAVLALIAIFNHMHKEIDNSIKIDWRGSRIISPDNMNLYLCKGSKRGILNLNTGDFTPIALPEEWGVEPSCFLEWFPDSQRVAFLVFFISSGDSVKLYEYHIHDKSLRRLGNEKYDTAFELVWDFSLAPGGLYAALERSFTGERGDETRELRILDLNSGIEKTLSEKYQSFPWCPPYWSRTGRWLVYFHYPLFSGENAVFYRVDIESGEQEEIFSENILDGHPDREEFMRVLVDKRSSVAVDFQISDDDKQMAVYVWDRELSKEGTGRDMKIWIYEFEAQSLEQIPYVFHREHASLSPDFEKIVSAELVDDAVSIYLYDLENDSRIKLALADRKTMRPTWTWDSERIIFVRGGSSIWIMNADGAEQRQIFPAGNDEE